MFYTRKWFLAAMLTGGALALAGCDDSGISQDTYNKTKQNVAVEKARADDLNSKLTKAKKDLDDAKAEAKDDVDRLLFDLAEAEKELEDAEKDLDDAKAEAKDDVDRLLFDLAEAEKELEDAEKDLDDAKAEAKDDVDSLLFDLAEAEKKLEDAEKDLDDAKAEAKDDVDSLLFDLAEAEKKLEDAEKDLDDAKAEAKDDVDSLLFDLAEAEKKLEDAEKDLDDAKAEAKDDVDSLLFDLAEAEKKLEDAEKDLDDAKAEAKDDVDSLLFDLAEAEKKLEDAEKDLDDAKAEAKDDVDSLLFDLAEAEKKLEDAEKDLDDAKAEAKDDVDSLLFDLAEAEKKLEDAEKDLDDAKAEAKDDVDSLLFDLAEAEKKLEDAEKDLDDAKAEANENIGRLTAEVNRLTSLLQTPMIRAAYSGKDSAGGARPGVLAGISDPTISTDAGKQERVYAKYDEDRRPQVQFSTGDEDSLSNPLDRSVAPIVGGYDGYRFEGEIGQSEKTHVHVVLYTDKRDKRVSYEMTGAASDGNVYSDGREIADTSTDYSRFWEDDLVYGPTEPAPNVGGRYIVKDQTTDGTYDGIAGSYECVELPDDAPGCNINDNVQIGVIKFTPTTPPADDFLTFGVWLTVPEQVEYDHSVGAYATGGDPFMGDVSKLKGIATYDGQAVGIYGKRDAGSETSDVGSFTAKASLTAEIVDGWVHGDVTNFMEKGKSLGKWWVKLNPGGSIGDAQTGLKFKGVAQISKTGDEIDMKGKGMWTGQFYGNGKVTDHPGSVAGTFNAKTSPVDDTMQDFLGIVGGFGAKKVIPPSDQ